MWAIKSGSQHRPKRLKMGPTILWLVVPSGKPKIHVRRHWTYYKTCRTHNDSAGGVAPRPPEYFTKNESLLIYKRHKKTRQKAGFFNLLAVFLALTGFETALRLVDDVNAAFTAHDTTVAVTLLQRAE